MKKKRERALFAIVACKSASECEIKQKRMRVELIE